MNTNINTPIDRLIEANNQYSIAMNKPFTFSKEQNDNIPDNAKNSEYWDEKGFKIMPDDRDEDELEVDDDLHENGAIDRHFLSNRDSGDEHYPDNEL
jgi:hypothetical protein